MKQIIAPSILLFAILAFSPADAGVKCKCRFNGGYIEEGQTACLKTPSGASLARCEKVLNNTSWKILNEPCPYASIVPNLLKDATQTPFPTIAVLSATKS